MEKQKVDIVGIVLISAFLISLLYAGFLAYKSIDWTILQRLEASPLLLPTPIPTAKP